MRLYTNRHGSWVGTQADARKEFGFKNEWREVDVPTDKPSLLEFLNIHKVGDLMPDPIVMKDGRPHLNLGDDKPDLSLIHI